jgi:hypothetical protein
MLSSTYKLILAVQSFSSAVLTIAECSQSSDVLS